MIRPAGVYVRRAFGQAAEADRRAGLIIVRAAYEQLAGGVRRVQVNPLGLGVTNCGEFTGSWR